MIPILTHAVLRDRSDRIRLRVTGPDRAKFLHNVTTNEVKRLADGSGVAAFVTSLQGKTLGFVTLLAGDAAILLRTDPGALAPILPHLQKYSIFDDVELTDVSSSTFEIHLAGPGADEIVGRATGTLAEPGDLRRTHARIGEVPIHLVRESPFGAAGITIIGESVVADPVLQAIRSAAEGVELLTLDADTAEALRIEAGTPCAGKDVLPDNLPQEVGIDAQAINFVKGCYLGQETIARIDALGHVNRHLRGLVIEGGPDDVPSAGSPLEVAGKSVGAVTSAAFAAWRGCPIALGYVRTAQSAAGTTVEVVINGERRRAVVVELPRPAV
jgi:tRNA-modifying protein YgfZ